MKFIKQFAAIVLVLTISFSASFSQDVKTAKKQVKILLNKNDYKGAIPHLKTLIRAKNDDSKSHMKLANSAININADEDELVEFYSSISPAKTKSLLYAANKFKGSNKITVAVKLYEMLASIDDKEVQSANYLSDYYYNTTKEYDKAYTHYIRKAKYVKLKQYESYYYAGHAAMELEKFQDGLDAFENAKKKSSKKDEPKVWTLMEERVMWATREVRDEPMRAKLKAKPLNVEIENMGENINSTYGDYCGTITADESLFLFTSRREGSTGSKKSDDQWSEDFWFSTKQEDGTWGKAANLGAPINTGNHEGIPSLSADGQTIYFYMNPNNGGGIYQSDITGEKWSKPVQLSFCSAEFWESQPSVSSDGNKIFFLSKRDKNDPNNSDIFYSTRKRSGKWKKAKNVGPTINTKYQEASPFIHPDGKTLYFSSQGHAGVGGYDIFKSVFDGKSWGEPVNVGYPINSRGSDQGFFLNAMGTKGYLYSQRDSNSVGGMDLYVVYLTPRKKKVEENVATDDTISAEPIQEIAESVKASSVTTIVGIVTDETSKEPIGTTIEMQNLTLNERVQDFKSNSKTGKYVIVLPVGHNYAIAIRKKGYLFHSENFNIPDSAASSIITKNISLKKIEVGKSIVLNNLFFETGSAELSTESTLELERMVEFMNDEKSVKIEISGFTDNVGSDESNKVLSEKRAKSVVNYLVTQKVEASRLIAKGYGEAAPIATNDTPEGRARNRRTEFKVTSK